MRRLGLGTRLKLLVFILVSFYRAVWNDWPQEALLIIRHFCFSVLVLIILVRLMKTCRIFRQYTVDLLKPDTHMGGKVFRQLQFNVDIQTKLPPHSTVINVKMPIFPFSFRSASYLPHGCTVNGIVYQQWQQLATCD